ncbi:Sugar transporter ERD6-like 6 [Sesamum angolense]|uniref:Sugar transporter ERD6-like 6 n=1 Tax=Sesamum angolense TaxID=2727404 RepID=A0AAE1VW76_9LAMI|nr:Sugar transporter ERD6-like 6 [Sesamum angolense]
MSFRDEVEDGRGDLRKPFLHTGSWYRMGSRQSSIMGSSQVIRDSSISVLACVLIVALGPIQFGFTVKLLSLLLFSAFFMFGCKRFEMCFEFEQTGLFGCKKIEMATEWKLELLIELNRSGYSSPTQSALSKDLDLTVSHSLMIAAIPNIIGWLAISFARDFSFLYMGRLLEGFAVGIISYTVPVYIAEIAPQNLRGGLGSVNQLSVTIGIMLAYLLGLFCSWRMLAVLGTLPCLILIPGLFFIPESPRWLAKMGMMDDFEASLQVLRGFDTDITLEVNEIKRSVDSTSRRMAIRFADLKLRRYWLPLMIGIGLLVLQQLAGTNGVIFYSTTIFESAGISSSNAATVGVGAIQVFATAVSTWLVDRTGRRILLIVSSFGMALSLLVVAIAFFLKGFVAEDSSLYGIFGILSVVGVVCMIVSFSLGMADPWLIMSEILPPKIKGLAGSVATLANWFSSWLITMTAPLLLAWSSGGTFSLYTVVCVFTVAFVAIWVPETKGKTLEEIQHSFR